MIVIAAGLAVLVLLAGVLTRPPGPAHIPQPTPAAFRPTAPPAAPAAAILTVIDPGVAALVGRVPITLAALDAGLPPDTFGPRLRRGRLMRIDRLIRMEQTRQYLDEEQVAADPAAIEARLAAYAEAPPPSDCGCCRYETMDEYLELNFVTPDEFRAMATSELRLEGLVDRRWNEALTAAGGMAAYTDRNREQVLAAYAHAAHIFFNCFQDPAWATDPGPVRERERAAAAKAVQRLAAGETFAALAAEVSEDGVSRKQGGDLGFATAGHFNTAFSDALFALAPGATSGAVETPMGFHVIRRLPLTEKDVEAVLIRAFRDHALTVIQTMITAIPVEKNLAPRPDESLDYMPE
ncbi:MAG: peptidylprolyl isomerase [Planctomycetota bacterium]